MTLTRKIVLAMVLGVAFGLTLNSFDPDLVVRAILVDGIFQPIGQIFIASLKVLVVPLVFVSIVCGTAAIDDMKKLGRIGIKTL